MAAIATSARQRLAARHAVLVDDDQPDGAQAELADARGDLVRRRRLLGAVEAVPGDEAVLADAADRRARGWWCPLG